MESFKGQVALVTGASGGIGKAIALALGSEGATVCLVGRKLAALKSVAGILQTFAPCPLCYPADLGLDEDIQALVRQLRKDFRKVDVLVHSAGAICLGDIEHSSMDDLDRQYRVNVRAPYALTQMLLPMIKSCHGQVVFLNSSLWQNARGGLGQYAATKYALKALADSLRDEVNADGIRVLSVFPGRTAGPMQAAVHQLEGKEYRPDSLIQPEDVASVIVGALTLPRSAEVTDISIRPLQKSK